MAAAVRSVFCVKWTGGLIEFRSFLPFFGSAFLSPFFVALFVTFFSCHLFDVTLVILFSVELTTFSSRWLTHTVYETKGVSPYDGWLLLIG